MIPFNGVNVVDSLTEQLLEELLLDAQRDGFNQGGQEGITSQIALKFGNRLAF